MLSQPGSETDAHPLTDAQITPLLASLSGQAHIALAVSGGADSTALMHLVHHWAGHTAKAPKISVLTVDHRLRAAGAGEASQVGRWAAQLGLAHHILQWRGEKPQTGVQAAARAARYRLMCGWCRDHGASHLVLAHHRQDQGETLMMRHGRGSGLDGLCGMALRSHREGVRLARPLLGVEPERLQAYLRQLGQGWVEDPSNQDRRYERVRVRRHLAGSAPARQQAEALLEAADERRRQRDGLEARADGLLSAALSVSEGGFCHFDRAGFADAPEEIYLRALKRIVLAVGGAAHPPQAAALARLGARMIVDRASGATLAGCRLLARGSRIWVVREARGAMPDLRLDAGISLVWDNRFAVRGTFADDAPLLVRRLGAKDWPCVRNELGGALGDLPAAAGRSLPGFYRGGELAALPFAGFGGDGFTAEFIQKWRLERVAESAY